MATTITIVSDIRELREAKKTSMADVIVWPQLPSEAPRVWCKSGYLSYIELGEEAFTKADLAHGISTIRLFIDNFIARISVGHVLGAGNLEPSTMSEDSLREWFMALSPEDMEKTVIRLWRLNREEDVYEVPSTKEDRSIRIGRRMLTLS